MEEKVIHIPFHRMQFIKCRKNVWTFANKRLIKPYIIYTILSIVCLMMGFTETKSDFPLSQIIGGSFLLYMILAWIGFFEKRIKYMRSTVASADRFDKISMDCTFTFSQDRIGYEDKEKLFKLDWQLFKPYFIFKDTIMLTLKEQGGVMFMFSKEELGENEFNEVCNILKEKVG